jgi:hypothetical protein
MVTLKVKAFADLIVELWSDSSKAVSPTKFKQAIGKFAPRFLGYAQQDSQEFLRFLLDGLHEDLYGGLGVGCHFARSAVLLRVTMVLELKPGHLCEAISAAAELMVDVARVEAWPFMRSSVHGSSSSPCSFAELTNNHAATLQITRARKEAAAWARGTVLVFEQTFPAPYCYWIPRPLAC